VAVLAAAAIYLLIGALQKRVHAEPL
jgi:hypothetical protein